MNHFPNRDYDVVLDHSRIAMEIERGKNLQNDLLLTIMTPEGGPKHMDPSGGSVLPRVYDMNVLAADAIDDFLMDWFHSFSPMTNDIVASTLEDGWNGSSSSGAGTGSVQISTVTPHMWDTFMSTGRIDHGSRSEILSSSSQKMEEIILLEPHKLTDDVGVKMYVDLYAREKRLLKNKRATALLKACGIKEKHVYGTAIVVKYTARGRMVNCAEYHLPDVGRDAARGKRAWEGMWMSVASMERNGRESLSAIELANVKSMEHVVECKSKGNALYAEGHYRRAIKEYTKGLELAPGCTPLLLNRALMFMKLQEYEYALPDLGLVVTRNPREEKAVYRTAQCMKEQGNPKSSIEFLLMYLETNRSAVIASLLKETYTSISS